MKRALALLVVLGAAGSALAQTRRAPDSLYSDRAGLFSVDERNRIRMRQDWFFEATACPIYVATFASAESRPLTKAASDIFTQWHAAEKRLPDTAIFVAAFGEERAARIVLGPTVPAEFEEALAGLPESRWEAGQKPGAEVEKLIAAADDLLTPIAKSLNRRGRFFLPPVPRTFLLDGDDDYSEVERREIEDALAGLAKESGHPVIFAVDPPGLPLANGNFGEGDIDRWTDEVFAAWRRDRPELDDGAVVFAIFPRFACAITYGPNVKARVPADVSRDFAQQVIDAQGRSFFGKAMVRIVGDLDRRFAGKRTVSPRSKLDILLHPWRLLVGPDEPAPLGLKIGAAALLAYFLGWVLWLVIRHPKIALLSFGGMFLGEVIGGAVSSVAGETVGKFVAGAGSFGGGGASGKW